MNIEIGKYYKSSSSYYIKIHSVCEEYYYVQYPSVDRLSKRLRTAIDILYDNGTFVDCTEDEFLIQSIQ